MPNNFAIEPAGGGGGGLTNINVSAGTTSNLLSAFTFSNLNGVSFGINASTITASVVGGGGLTNINISAGTTSNLLSNFTFSNLNGISFGLNSSTITASVATSLTNINISAGTTSNNASALTFANSNGLSFGLNASTITGSYTVPVQSNGILDISTATASGTATSRFAMHDHVHRGIRGIAAVGTASTFFGDFNLSGGNGVTLITGGASTAGSVGISVANQSNQQMTMFATGNTTQSSTGTTNASSIVFRAEGIASIGITAGSIVISVPAGAPSPVNFSAGTTSGNLGSVVFADANKVSFGLNGSTITAKYALNFSAGTTSQNISDQIVFSNSNGVSFGLNGSTITGSVAAAGGGATGSFLNLFHAVHGGSYINATQWPGNGSIQVFPVNIEQAYSFSKFLMSVSLSISTSTNSSHGGTISMGVGWYSKNGSTLSLATSGLGAPVWTNTSNNSTGSLSGIREISGTFAAMNLTPGDWWLAVWSMTSTVNANWFTASNLYYGTVATNSTHSGAFGAAAGAASFQAGIPGNGTFSATSIALPVSMAFSHITGTARTALRPHIAFRNFDA